MIEIIHEGIGILHLLGLGQAVTQVGEALGLRGDGCYKLLEPAVAGKQNLLLLESDAVDAVNHLVDGVETHIAVQGAAFEKIVVVEPEVGKEGEQLVRLFLPLKDGDVGDDFGDFAVPGKEHLGLVKGVAGGLAAVVCGILQKALCHVFYVKIAALIGTEPADSLRRGVLPLPLGVVLLRQNHHTV